MTTDDHPSNNTLAGQWPWLIDHMWKLTPHKVVPSDQPNVITQKAKWDDRLNAGDMKRSGVSVHDTASDSWHW